MTTNARVKIAVIIEDDNKIFLQKERYTSQTTHLWNIVTGTYEPSDGPIVNSAIRECREEAGLAVEITRLYRVITESKEKVLRVYFVFVASPVGTTEKDHQPDENIGEQKYITKADVANFAKVDFVSNLVAEVALDYCTDKEINILKDFDKEISQ